MTTMSVLDAAGRRRSLGRACELAAAERSV
jgi:hypothetical protein